MIPLIIISAIAIVYGLVRAKHDSFISHGKWKRYAFLEGFLIDLVIVSLTVFAFRLSWFQIPGLALSFAFVFWIVFDCACGYFRTGDILYIGEFGWDAKARASWHYNRPFLFFKYPRGLKYLLFKIFDAVVTILITISLIKTFG